MKLFPVSEDRALAFHGVMLELMRDHPNLVIRAQEQLVRMRGRKPNVNGVFDRWEALLSRAVDDMASDIMADGPDGGLLRANSPFNELLSSTERNMVWQRIGLQQFAGFFLEAVEDLGLTGDEQAVLSGLPESEIAGWTDALPQRMTTGTLEHLKAVVSVHQSLVALIEDGTDRRAWLRAPNANLGGRPIDLLMAGKSGAVRAYLTAEIQERMSNAE